jgi:hypothetical protein
MMCSTYPAWYVRIIEIKSEIDMSIRQSHTSMLLAAALVCGGLAGCTTLQVSSDLNPRASITSCHTYAWAEEIPARRAPGGAPINPVNAARLRAALDSRLQARGLQLVAERSAADCVVGYAIGVRQIVDPYPYEWGWGAGWGWGRRGFVGAWGADWPLVYSQGLIAVDVYESKGREPIWHVSVTEDVTELTGSKAEARINAAVDAMFAKFPGTPVHPPAGAGNEPRSTRAG